MDVPLEPLLSPTVEPRTHARIARPEVDGADHLLLSVCPAHHGGFRCSHLFVGPLLDLSFRENICKELSQIPTGLSRNIPVSLRLLDGLSVCHVALDLNAAMQVMHQPMWAILKPRGVNPHRLRPLTVLHLVLMHRPLLKPTRPHEGLHRRREAVVVPVVIHYQPRHELVSIHGLATLDQALFRQPVTQQFNHGARPHLTVAV